MSTIEMVGTFVLVVALILIVTAIYLAIATKFEEDAAGLSTCQARAAQAGGRGFCSTTSDCAQPVAEGTGPKAGEYAQYLGIQCRADSDEDTTVNQLAKPDTYCCIIMPNNRNPPAAAPTGGGGA